MAMAQNVPSQNFRQVVLGLPYTILNISTVNAATCLLNDKVAALSVQFSARTASGTANPRPPTPAGSPGRRSSAATSPFDTIEDAHQRRGRLNGVSCLRGAGSVDGTSRSSSETSLPVAQVPQHGPFASHTRRYGSQPAAEGVAAGWPGATRHPGEAPSAPVTQSSGVSLSQSPARDHDRQIPPSRSASLGPRLRVGPPTALAAPLLVAPPWPKDIAAAVASARRMPVQAQH